MADAPDDDELVETLIGVFREIDGLFSTVSRQQGLTPQQAQLLCFAQHLQPAFGELATLLHCDKTNVTGLVDRLQRRGLLTRQPDPNDRRMTRVRLTPQGEAVTAQFKQAIGATLTTRFSSWPSAERDNLVRLLQSATTELRP
ncbi:MarR family winged helix-turn-helix transcriptional regulator [Nonomuraea jiangxiensis]|uniref:DNA-binding transcriptional regulator, MarR family n=1 Tax=Nonomuraea jiangxiensis TaxID=633440 RepID=A0A1G8LIV9_9ACTN|nr:MarR family transcriptional regulator [Nonomuraea jiangxiensis]SDI55578.1 DNA-binding transcriptional regulator, MarR family [Nonomuraea jiangxiensis]